MLDALAATHYIKTVAYAGDSHILSALISRARLAAASRR
jgi:hypothetical protein